MFKPVKPIEMMSQDRSIVDQLFTGKSEMAMRMRARFACAEGNADWSQSALGSVETWPQSLRSTLSICLNSRFPIAIYWGPDSLLLYNDAWRPIVGDKHPWALGRPGREVWSEIWDDIGPELAGVLATGEGTFHQDALLLMYRFGYTEECFFDYTFNPIQGQGGGIDGVLNIVSETTYRVVNDRRARVLKEVASKTGTAKTAEEACSVMAAVLRSAPADIPFLRLYLIDPDQQHARLCAGSELDSSISPTAIDLADDDRWLIARTARTARSHVIDDLATQFGLLPGSPWPEPAQEAMVLPMATPGQKVLGVLVAVASPRRRLDENYRDFFEQIAAQIAAAIANARAYEEERKRAEALAELDRAKTAFFSNVSHEFRTPLTLMLSPLEELSANLDGRLDTDEREQLQLVQRNGLRLQKLVNTLLDFSRIEAGRVQAVFEPIDLAAFTADLASVFRSLIERAGMSLTIECPTLPERVYVDRDLWEKIVLNLISNAFKFTFEGGVTVRLRAVDRAVELSVEDTGVGIPDAELPRLFERFHRVVGARSRTYEGSGIGLALVQELVKLHGGTIRVSSQVDRGTTFTIAVPFGSDHLPQDRIQSTRSLDSTALGATPFIEEASRWLPEAAQGSVKWAEEAGTIAPPLPIPYSLPHVRILLADDNADMRDYVKRLLSSRFEVETVINGAAALTAVRSHPPDLVLTDVMMPELDGFELLQRLRSDPTTQEIPIILLSARAGEEARIEGLAAGADDYLTKPFSARELLARVEANLKLSQLRREAGQREQGLRREAETARQQVERILSSINDGFYVLDRDWRFTYVNDRYCDIVRMPRSALIGQNIWEIFPAAIDTEAYVQFHQAMCDQTPHQFDYFYAPWQCWHDHRIYPSLEGLTVFLADITDRKQLEAERAELLTQEQAAREVAETANRLKDEFLAVLSHELRTPMNPILGWASLLKQGKLSDQKKIEAIATIERNAKLQVQLIDDLLDISRILRGKLSLTMQPVDLNPVISSALETVRLAAEAKSLHVQTELSAIALVNGDAGRLQQVVWNLLSNAIKFTPSGGRVIVELTQTDTIVQIQVKDTGKGIQPDFLPYVFQHFRQEDAAITRQFGGLGLGLAIARQLVELHGGQISVASPGEGQGATFTVQIPLAFDSIGSPTKQSAPSALDLSGLQLLVVDDEADSRDFVAFVLEQAGAIVTSVASGIEALQAIDQSIPSGIISDIGMPDMDGYMLMQQVRAQAKPIPAIALTAYAGEYDRQQAIAAGFQDHLAKPVEPEKLVSLIRALCTAVSNF